MVMSRLLAALLLTFAVGCATPADEPPGTATPSSSVAPPSAVTDTLPDLPETKAERVYVEGEPQETTLFLVREDDAALPFATYRPEDVRYASTSSGEGEGYRFTFGEDPFDASLHVFIPNPASGLDDPSAYATAMAGEGVALEPMGDAAPWVEAAYRWRRDGRVGSVMAGTHEGRRFYVVEDLQEEMGDGFAPRAATILTEWQWLSNGKRLE